VKYVSLELGVLKMENKILRKISMYPYGANYGGTKWCKCVKNIFFVFTQNLQNLCKIKEKEKPSKFSFTRFTAICGEIGIRTPGTSRFNSFQDCRNRPLCHFSREGKNTIFFNYITNFFQLFF
jgi:hypothetical protein